MVPTKKTARLAGGGVFLPRIFGVLFAAETVTSLIAAVIHFLTPNGVLEANLMWLGAIGNFHSHSGCYSQASTNQKRRPQNLYPVRHRKNLPWRQACHE